MKYYVVATDREKLPYFILSEYDLELHFQQYENKVNLWATFAEDGINVFAIYEAEFTSQGLIYTASIDENMERHAL